MKVSPKVILPVLALAWLAYIMVSYNGVDRSYFLLIATLPFSLVALIMAEIVNSMVGGYSWGNTVAGILMVLFLLIESYYLGKLCSWVWVKVAKRKKHNL